jgi:hypothetical protein
MLKAAKFRKKTTDIAGRYALRLEIQDMQIRYIMSCPEGKEI